MNKTIIRRAGLILQSALRGLQQWENEQQSLDDYLDQIADQDIRPPVSSLLFNYFRKKALIDSIISKYCQRPPKNKHRRLLALVLTQCYFQHGITAQSAVNIGVDTAKRKFNKATAGFINGVLRNIMRDGINDFVKEADSNPLFYFPKQLQKRWKQRFSQAEQEQLSQSLKSEPLLTFRLTGDVSQEELQTIEAKKLDKFEWANDIEFYSTLAPKIFFEQSLLREGRVYVQDPAAVMSPSLVDINGGEKILDTCAAPGGKALVLAERLNGSGKLFAADRSAKRQRLTRENFDCRNLNCEIVVGSATELDFAPESFDIILTDVPCTNTGVFRHKVDALWRFSKKSLNETVKLQREILDSAAKLLASGGRLIYSTCSIESEENENQIEAFLDTHKDFQLDKQNLLLPSEYHDGAYAAILIKK